MRMITVFFGSLFALMLTSARAQQACMSTDPPNCSVYNDCIDVNCKCASTEFTYPATFGPKYCARFQQNQRFSHAGRAWREKTLACLVDQASRAYAAQRPPQCNCQALEAQMIDSHTTCYVQAPSFCDLPDGDIRVVARIVDAKDFLSLGIAGVREVGRTLVACASQKHLERAVTITRVFVGETLTEGTEDARNYATGVLEEAANAAGKAGLKDYEKRVKELRDQLLPQRDLP